jgi:hypothetical protein
MSDIVKTNNDHITSLEVSVIKSSSSKKVIQTSENDLNELILDCITLALFDLRQSLEDNEIQILKSRIVFDLKLHWRGLTIWDIKQAFELGSRGHFRAKPDEVVMLSVEKVYNWIKAYKIQIKEPAMKKAPQLLLKENIESREYTPEEIQKKNKEAEKLEFENIKNAFNIWKDGNVINDPYGIMYEFMNRRGMIKLSKERRQEIYKKELEEYISNLKDSDGIVKGVNRAEKEKNRDLIDLYNESKDKLSKLVHPDLKRCVDLKCMHIAIRKTFEDIHTIGMTIEEFLNDQQGE